MKILVPVDLDTKDILALSEPPLRFAEHACGVDGEIEVLYVQYPMRHTVDFEQLIDFDDLSELSDIKALRKKKKKMRKEHLQTLMRVMSKWVRSTIESDIECRVAIETSSENVGDVIVQYAKDHGFDHIAIAGDGSNRLKRFVLGSTAERVIRRSRVPVTVFPAQKKNKKK